MRGQLVTFNNALSILLHAGAETLGMMSHSSYLLDISTITTVATVTTGTTVVSSSVLPILIPRVLATGGQSNLSRLLSSLTQCKLSRA